ncbi:hypothetical protein F441_07176 [Phytophthora nicotianae CJ01A1]|uniref:RxLR effector protein n=3 Tax=Phytophthora nicotianae TaxID=4792 RepID=W2QDP4_PHYN3|nr:hypothetical protein PPTG_09765 [Phytophthora nicotianae INRA-310]ETL42130.1 hypothetical protein L916_07002 [Phytophthora nicotianae]ETN10659.1 hypothetical protein PPTG_09765 [Phytophthora nicotianae INRA-310]ETP18619.1 hypothetical protein F441_07176 [Phytophthora nicotianae CJ01A1]KUG00230.1 hypothetical protein AM587_10001073 [Phytophthora nicotianae]
MRVCITLVVALVSLLVVNSAVLAAKASTLTDLVQFGPRFVENRQRDSFRFLRTRQDDGLDNEERGVKEMGNYVVKIFSKEKRLLDLFTKARNENNFPKMSKKGGPDLLKDALKYLRKKGVADSKLIGLDDIAERFSTEWYRVHGNLYGNRG